MHRSSLYLVLLLFLFFPLQTLAQTFSVKSDKINLRSGPGENHSIKCVYSKGFPVKILKKRGDWVQVTDFENEIGWVSKQHLSATPHAIVSMNKGSNKRINIRSGPGFNYPVVGQAYYGVVFSITGKNGDWEKVRHTSSGVSGWIQGNLLWGD